MWRRHLRVGPSRLTSKLRNALFLLSNDLQQLSKLVVRTLLQAVFVCSQLRIERRLCRGVLRPEQRPVVIIAWLTAPLACPRCARVRVDQFH